MKQRPSGFSRVAAHVWPALVIGFLSLPIVLATLVAFSSGDRLEFPVPGFSLRWFEAAARNAQFLDGLLNSIIVALCSAALATVAGTGAAIAFNHYRFTGRAAAQLTVMLPVSLPAIVLGLGLLFVLPTYGLRPGLLAATLGHATLGIPYVVAMVTSALSNYDRALERASANLGVGPVRTFFRITLPLIRGGIIAGAISAFLISLDNVSLSLFITRGDTLPLRLMQQLLFYADPSIAAVSTIVLGVSLLLLVLVLPVALLRRSSERAD
ncbi:ABC transporter permease [Reyranella sp.]|uniref:ABC transporter permease n=1 Tax=Reyranella sp. TaxID=1929291 RepID=UPI003D119D0E